MNEPAWRLASAWRLHGWPFEAVLADGEGSTPVYAVATADVVGTSDVRPYWSMLPSHANLLAPVASQGDRLLVRYAPLDWARATTNDLRTQVRWGRQLIAVYDHVRSHVSNRDLGRFLHPFVRVDVGSHLRVGFLSLHSQHDALAELPADIAPSWPICEAAHLPFVVGKLLDKQNYVDDARLRILLHRACDPSPRRRFRSLGELDEELAQLGRGHAVRYGDELAGWRAFDEGAGWLELGQYAKALVCFEEALKHDPDIGQAIEGYELAGRAVSERFAPRRGPQQPVTTVAPRPPVSRITSRAWEDVEALGMSFEQRRDFLQALDVYRTVEANPRTNLALCTARARCHLGLGQLGEALDNAQRALGVDGSHIEALDILVAAMLARRWHPEALRNAEQLCELAPNSARAHYLRGKALVANGRLPDARDAFERASQLDPKLLEAQVLRREVERVAGSVHKSVGSQHGPMFDIPEQLAELRDVLVGGDIAAALAALADERYVTDADAQLLLARLLVFDRRFDAAFEVYDRLVATSHRVPALVGKATALLELGKPGDALDILTQLPDDADAAEGAARALEMLGRIDEAAAAYRRFIALASSGSELRVRAAQLWLASR